jgi:hypothetical protein
MPGPDRTSGTWRTIRRFISGADQPNAVGRGAGQGNDTRSRNESAVIVRVASRALRAIYARVLRQVQETQRSNELMMQETARRERRAKRRSLVLLMRLLNGEQRREFRESRHFHVTGGASGDRYRIWVGRIANIDVLRDDGTVRHRLCVQPAGGIPVYDVMAAQLLYLQDPASEQRFLRQANVHPALPEERIYSRSPWIA